MALKIRTGAEDLPGRLKHIETGTHIKWRRTGLLQGRDSAKIDVLGYSGYVFSGEKHLPS